VERVKTGARGEKKGSANGDDEGQHEMWYKKKKGLGKKWVKGLVQDRKKKKKEDGVTAEKKKERREEWGEKRTNR